MPSKILHTGKCLYCSKTFSSPTSAQYCNQNCYHAHRRVRTKRECKACGKEFYKKNQGHHGVPIYCSMKCQTDGRDFKLTRKCRICGKAIKRQRKEILRNRGTYCSRSCSDAGKFSQITMRCQQCEKVFQVRKGRKETARFCSRRCMVHFKGETGIEKAAKHALDQLGLLYIQEYKVNRFHVDFFLPMLGIALEIDGMYWHERPKQKDADRRKEARLASKGIITVRISDKEINQHQDLVSLVRQKLGIKPKRKRRKPKESLQANLFELSIAA